MPDLGVTARAPVRPIDVYCYPVSRDSAYVPLLFAGIEATYRCVFREEGTLADAIAALDAGRDVIVHVHWEEFVLRGCSSTAEADDAARAFAHELAAIRERHGAIVWTVHNERPHLIGFHPQFFAMRAALAAQADAILVHDATSIDVLAEQVDLDRAKIVVLPHPSYLGRHEDEASLRAGLAMPGERRIQGFGWIRLQKGFGDMIGMLPAAFLQSRRAWIRISGDRERDGDDAEAAVVIAQQAERTDVEWDIRHVPDAEVPSLLRSAACVVLPYERMLTSGVALLAMSVGAMIVAVDIPQMRDLLPEQSRRFLYPRGEGAAFRAVLDDVFALTPQRRRTILAANLAVARERRPAKIARRLAAVYGGVGARRSA